MFGADGVVGSMKRVLHVTDQGVYPGELFMLDTLRSTTRYDRDVLAASCCDSWETVQTVGYHGIRGKQVLTRLRGNLCSRKRLHFAHTHGNEMTLFVRRNSGHDWHFGGGTAAAFAPTALTTPIGIIDLNRSAQRLTVIALFHRLHQLVFYAPCSGVGNPELAFQGQSRDAGLTLGEQVYGEKPGGQCELGRSKDRPTDDRSLVVTVVTLVELPGFEFAMAVSLTLWADKSVRPTPSIQCLFTLLLGTVGAQERREAEALLELHRILRHNEFLISFRQFHHIAPTGAVADLRQ